MGIFDEPITHEPITEFTPCVNGFAGTEENNTFACRDLDLYTFLSHEALGSEARFGSDIWGWTYEDAEKKGEKREFGLVGQYEGTAFVEIVGAGKVLYLGRLPTQSVGSIWRDIKVIGDYAYIGSEAEGHGIQVFDLKKSLALEPKTFSIDTDLTAWHDLPIGRSHNIVSHAGKNLIAAVGSVPRDDACRAGLIFVDVTDPANPKSAGCAWEDGYTHDAQCLTYIGPDTKYNGSDICYAYNEDSFTIYDITDPAEPAIISRTGYYGVSYSHQGWVVDELDQRYVLLDDELDELNSTGWAADQRTVTYIWDIQNLSAPILTGHYKSPQKAIDHNLYVVDGLAYESNYGSGLRVIDVSSVAADPTGAGFKEVAFFDVHPEDDDVGGIAEFTGSWSVYPYFESGYILVNSIERGLFVLKRS
ncbi:hypothetical protein PUNSTDRAFT_72471 [Punctularia strigosozonata HHB-11173 SS5]|uniref:uncharacterized protein n=1 Tax=Punctularia strigosozonata (strain HHB-11173) TaxID=741275 RepID=UPI000441829D|nr:uncharacterized protein PUNSTDRAFT_72471 [Punctularia strigosozonata HHB-11173 SS5]EIN06800.1 hypothetical protein PUNSTDRAFT_72471 [Punctularia strigosozonata HHB-11173 SS5]